VSTRPLVFVSGLTVGDYLLWNWSLNSNHDVLALVSGLTLPPLGVALLWLLALSLMRVLARFGRAPARRTRVMRRAGVRAPSPSVTSASSSEDARVAVAAGERPGKIAA
jgi:hypothetical protein